MVLMSKEEIIGRMFSDMPFFRDEDKALFLHTMIAIKKGEPTRLSCPRSIARTAP